MTNYIIMWQRDGNEGFDFINAKDEDSAIELWLDNQNGFHPDGRLFKMIITETSNTYKVPLDSYGYYYGVDK
jgi:hypothetical protein